MHRKQVLATMRALLAFMLSDLQVIAMWFTGMLETFPSETFLSTLYTTSLLLFNAFDAMVCLYADLIAPVIAISITLITELLLIISETAEKITQVFWTALATVITFSSPYVNDFVSSSASVLTWSTTMLLTILEILLKLVSKLTVRLPVDIRPAFQSATFVTSLCSENIALLSLLLLSFWLSRPADSTGQIRADQFANVLARKCMVSRDHTSARLVGLIYLLTSFTALCNLGRSSTDYSSCVAVILSVWTLRQTAREKVLRNLDISGVVTGSKRAVQEARKFCANHLGGSAKQEELVTQLRDDLAKTRAAEKALQVLTQDLQTQCSLLDQTMKQQQSQLEMFKRKKDAYSQDRARAIALAAKIKLLEKDLNTHRQESASLLREKVEAQFEIELAKCTSQTLSQDNPTILSDLAVPFVLVLIDGDAYSWSTYHFAQTQYPPGANAAQAIKREVQKYLVGHKDRISVQSRIIVRVFQNIQTGHPTKNVHHSDYQIRSPADFPRDFTQSMPLFDFVDSGIGKERVDSKIQEFTHVFISNPSCQRIFLAASTDNGFARMLEQYACDEAMREKVVIIHPGYVIREIDALGFEKAEWQSVFRRQAVPVFSQKKTQRMALDAARAKWEREVASVKMMIEIAPNMDIFRELSRGGVSGVFHKTGKEIIIEKQVRGRTQIQTPSQVDGQDQGQAQDQEVLTEKIEQIVLDKGLHVDPNVNKADVLTQAIKEVCNSMDPE